MNRTKLIMVLIAVFMAGATTGWAGARMNQHRQKAKFISEFQKGGKGALPGILAERLGKKLNLDSSQKTMISENLKIVAERVRAMKMRERPELNAIADEFRKSVEPSLSPEQNAQLSKLVQQHFKKVRGKKGKKKRGAGA